MEPTPESGNSFLNRWASEMKTKPPQKTYKTPQTETGENDSLKILFGPKNQYPIPSAPVIPETSLRQLQQLMYSKQNVPIPEAVGTLPSRTMEAHIALAAAREKTAKPTKKDIKADLSDVSLDD